jgi:uncharacterized protein (TIGR04255 family)
MMANDSKPAEPASLANGDDFFPPAPRVAYDRAPLIGVVAQLRYPTLLRIEKEPPADFQESVRRIFPLLERGPAHGIGMGQQLPAAVLQLLAATAAGPVYRFLTEDRQTTLTLAPDSLSLNTTAYKHWADFKTFLAPSLTALSRIYGPSFYSRIGLRYTNAIERGPLNLTGTPWSRLLRPELLGELVIPQLEQHSEMVSRTLQLRMPNGREHMLILHGLGVVQGRSEQAYTIDCDYYVDQRTEMNLAESILDKFNDRASRAFRWFITDTLHNAFGPTELAGGVTQRD